MSRPTPQLLGCLLTVAVGLALGAPSAQADTIRNGEFWLQQYGITQAQQITTGTGVRVGIFDDGPIAAHPDLPSSVVVAHRQYLSRPDTVTGHNTMVASVLVARGHGAGRGDGMLGVAPGATLVSAVSDDPHLPDAVRWAVSQGATVLNFSIAGACPTPGIGTDPLVPAIAYAEAHDVVVVAGAGNDSGGQTECPAGYDGVVAVNGVVKDGTIDAVNHTKGPRITIAAASGTVQRPENSQSGGYPAACPSAVCSGGYDMNFGGTSGATAIVSGVVALIRAKYPCLSAAGVIERLIKTTTNKPPSGHDDLHGYGIVNANNALTATNIPEPKTNPLGTLPGGTDTAAPDQSKCSDDAQSPNSGSSSSSHTGLYIYIAVSAVVVAAIIAVLTAMNRRNRHRRTATPPGWYPPPR